MGKMKREEYYPVSPKYFPPQQGVEHDARFKRNCMPSRSGYSCTLAPFPEYKEDPPREKVRKVKLEDEPDGPAPMLVHHW